jgi:small GTP-binding protein
MNNILTEEEDSKIPQSISRSDTYHYIFKIILIGDANIGKTSLINRYINRYFSDKYICTIGVDFFMKSLIWDDNRIKLQIWDTAGMEKYKQITVSYYRGAQAAVVCFDLTSKASFNSIKRWIDDFSQYHNITSAKAIIIVGTKSDLVEEREVKREDIDKFIEANKYPYFECSAKNDNNVDEMFLNLAKFLYEENKQKKYSHRTTKLIDMEKYQNLVGGKKKCSC